MSLFHTLKRRLYPVYRNYFARAYLYEGALRDGRGTPLRCLFIDNDRFYLQVSPRLFADPPRLVRTFRCWLPGLVPMLASPFPRADICIANLPLRYPSLHQRLCGFRMQTRVNQSMDLTGGPPSNRRYREQRKKVGKKIEKHGLTCRISRDPADFRFFYHRMYIPLIAKFGDGAIVETSRDLEAVFTGGFLLLVLRDGEPVSASLSYDEHGTLTHSRSGLLDGNPSLLQMGAMSAIYYFLLEHAIDRGYRRVDFMRSLPFLNDGVYAHKQEWGAVAAPIRDASSWVYLINRGGPERFARVIETIPPVTLTYADLEGVVAIPDAQDPLPDLPSILKARYRGTGLNGIHLVAGDGTRSYLELGAGP